MSKTYIFSLQSLTEKDFFSSRSHAAMMRKEIESHIGSCESIILDFSETEMTQSFADELVGVLAYLHGPDLFKKLKFKGCSNESKQIINFVVHRRLNDRTLQPKKNNSQDGNYQSSEKIRNKIHRMEACA